MTREANDASPDTTATGRVQPKVAGDTLLLNLSQMTLPLHIQPLGYRIDLGNISAVDFIPPQARNIRIDMKQLGIPIIMTGNKTSVIRFTQPGISLDPPFIRITAKLTL